MLFEFLLFGSLWSGFIITEPKARSINFHKRNETNIFPIRTEQAGLMKDLFLCFFTNLKTAKRIPITKRALQGRKKRTNDFLHVIFAKVFAKIIGKKARTRFRLHTKLSSLLEFFQNTI